MMAPTSSTESLVAAAQQGDEAAFGELVERHYATVHGLATTRTRNWSAAEDVTQEVFLLAWINLERLKQPKAFPAWLRCIARNAATSWLRNRECRRKLAMRRTPRSERDGDNPAAAAARQECFTCISGVMSSLSPKLREALALYYLEGKTVAESAEALGVREDTMKKRLRLGRLKLQEKFMERAPSMDFEQCLPYSAAPYRERVLGALAGGPAVLNLGRSAAASGPGLMVDHLAHGGSVEGLETCGLATPLLKIAGGALVVLMTALLVSTGVVLSLLTENRAPDEVVCYEGVGLFVTRHWDHPEYGSYCLVEEVLPGCPAAVAGILPGDRIVAINGRQIRRGFLADSRMQFRGPAGSIWHATVMRSREDGSAEQLEFDVTRGYVPRDLFLRTRQRFGEALVVDHNTHDGLE